MKKYFFITLILSLFLITYGRQFNNPSRLAIFSDSGKIYNSRVLANDSTGVVNIYPFRVGSGVEIGIPFSFQDKELKPKIIENYKTFVTKISKLRMVTDSTDGIKKYGDDVKKIIKTYSGAIIELYKKKKLPVINSFNLAGNKYFVIIPYLEDRYDNVNHNVDYSGATCGPTYSLGDPEYSLNKGCFYIKQAGNNLELLHNSLIKFDSRTKLDIVNNKFIYNEFSDGAGDGGWSYYSLFDKNLTKISIINSGGGIGDDEFYGSAGESYSKNGFLITLTYNNNYKNGVYLKYLKEIKNKKGETQYIQLKGLLYLSGGINLDYKKNLLNGNKFEYQINGKEQVFDFNNYKNSSLSTNSITNYFLTKDNDVYQVLGTLEGTITKVEVLSCKNNGSKYDSKWYKINKIETNEGLSKFNYNISKKLNNYCKIPYKVRIYGADGNKKEKIISEDEFEVMFED